MGEKVAFPQLNEELELPEGVREVDLSRATAYRGWKSLRIKVSRASATEDEKQTFDSVPTIAGRPAWVSLLTKDERVGFVSACAFAEQVQKDPDSYFEPMDQQDNNTNIL